MPNTAEAQPPILRWAAAPSSAPTPFPQPRESGAWFAGDLPAAELAAVLAARGFRRGTATGERVVREGSPVPTVLVDEELASLHDELADLVDASPEAAADARLDVEARAIVARAPDGRWGSAGWEARLAAERRADGVRAEKHGAASLARALRDTATDLRRKSRAAKNLRPRVVARLPVAEPDTADVELATAWLAQYDAEPIVRRAELVRAYALSGAPGGLNATHLRALMIHRWGEPSKRDGYDVHKPAARATGHTDPDLDAIARLLGVPAHALAALVAEHRPPNPEEPIP